MNWHLSIDSVAAFVASLLAILGAWWKLAKKDGAQEKELEMLKTESAKHDAVLTSHTAQLASGEGNFKVIDAKLDNIIKGQDEQRRIYESTQDLLFKHITGEKQ